MTGPTQPGEEDQITIHQLAQDIRKRGIEELGEKEFAKSLLVLDEAIKGEKSKDRLNLALAMLGITGEARIHQLIMVWLDGAGFGSATVAQLLSQVERVQQQFPGQLEPPGPE